MELYRDSIAQWQQAGASFDAERARMLADLAVMETNNGRRFDAEKTAQEALALRRSRDAAGRVGAGGLLEHAGPRGARDRRP